MAYSNSAAESLLVLSDVHLGSDLNDSGSSVPRSRSIDDDLAAFFAHYRSVRPPAGRWRLVLAGDFLDFVGMAIDPREGDELTTALTPMERAFGLGGAEDHVRLKLRRVAERHPDVIRELAAFVYDGHALTFVVGNHDTEMYWPSVQRDFCALLTTGSARLEDVAARVKFEPWFFYREGLVYVEHGHQYDPFCAQFHLLAPLSPTDPTRVHPSLSDTLLRYIVRRTPGMKEYGHETRGLASYISWGLMLGARGTAGLFRRFFSAVSVLRDVARANLGENGARLAEEHWRRLAERAKKTGIGEDRLRAALALHVAPLGATPRSVLSSVMLDRLSVFCIVVVSLVAIFFARHGLNGYALPTAAAVLVLWAALHALFSRGRPNVDPAAMMGARASELAKLFPASFVVMGHTHVPMTNAVGDAIYVNVGSWAEEEPDASEDAAKAYRAARTHLVVHAFADRHEAQLCEWTSGQGPRTRSSFARPIAAPPVVETRAAS